MTRRSRFSYPRREFMRRAAAVSAAMAAPAGAIAQSTTPAPSPAPEPSTTEPEPLTGGRAGSDFMVDTIKALGFEYVCANPGSSFRGLHESVINYGGNEKPELLTCMHEESAVAMAHGYFKIEGKPLAVMAHGTVGLQHASMALYNAWCDRVPVYLLLGNTLDATMRAPGVEWVHSVQDAAAMVRDYTKWDDTPMSLPHFAESAVRAYKIAMTPPYGPVVIVADSELQEHPIADHHGALRVPQLSLAAPPQADSGAVAEAARLLVAADSPLLIADRLARTPAGLARLIELAELLQAAVISTQPNSLPPIAAGRMNFPNRHPLNQTLRSVAAIADADLIAGLEIANIYGATHIFRDQLERTSRPATKAGVKLITITAGDLNVKANYQDFQRYVEADLSMAADGEATLPALIEAVRRLITPERRRAFDARGAKLADASRLVLERARTDAAYAWDASPISTARLSAEIWNAVRGHDWALVSEPLFPSLHEIWEIDKHYQYIGGSGGAGMGYGAPAAVGAALAHRDARRLVVNVQKDGDLMYCPGALWTAVHHDIPLLSVMHNNRAYHQELMHVQRMAARRRRGVDGSAKIGTTLEDPFIDYATLAKGMGMWSAGPIEDPAKLAPVLREAVAVVASGKPAFVDVVCQPR